MKKIILTSVLLATLTLTLNATEKKHNVVTMGEVMILKKKLSKMTTPELEAKVEECSNRGTMPFEMGAELLKRWNTKKS